MLLTTVQSNKRLQQGFTLIELLVVIGILAILLAITLIAINPARQFAQANDTKRRSDVNAILNAIDQYAADHSGTLPAGVSGLAADTATEIAGGAGNADICSDVVTTYLAALPVDPSVNNGTPVSSCSATYDTGYKVSHSSSDNRVTVTAPHVELAGSISVTR